MPNPSGAIDPTEMDRIHNSAAEYLREAETAIVLGEDDVAEAYTEDALDLLDEAVLGGPMDSAVPVELPDDPEE